MARSGLVRISIALARGRIEQADAFALRTALAKPTRAFWASGSLIDQVPERVIAIFFS